MKLTQKNQSHCFHCHFTNIDIELQDFATAKMRSPVFYLPKKKLFRLYFCFLAHLKGFHVRARKVIVNTKHSVWRKYAWLRNNNTTFIHKWISYKMNWCVHAEKSSRWKKSRIRQKRSSKYLALIIVSMQWSHELLLEQVEVRALRTNFWIMMWKSALFRLTTYLQNKAYTKRFKSG